MLAKLLQGVQPNNKIYVEDVFSTYTYTGNNNTQGIVNGVDLATKGGMVWTKPRTTDGTYGGAHTLRDTVRGLAVNGTNGGDLASNATNGSSGGASSYPSSDQGFGSFNSNGFSLNAVAGGVFNGSCNTSGVNYVSWSFRKAPKFFDVVTYTGNGVNGRTIAHSLGGSPGMIFVKRADVGGPSWITYHRSITATKYMYLNDTLAASTYSFWASTEPTSGVFSVSNDTEVNANGGRYVAYLFAHDTSTDGMIQCGSFTDSSGGVNVTLGWEAQYVMIKRSDGTSNWLIYDTARNWSMTDGEELKANTTATGSALGGPYFSPTATGFKTTTALFANGATVVYTAIRRPMKTPTSAYGVFQARKGNGAGSDIWANEFTYPCDLVLASRIGTEWQAVDRLRGMQARFSSSANDTKTTNPWFSTTSTNTESASNCIVGLYASGFGNSNTDRIGGNVGPTSQSIYGLFFRRAVGFMDIVCYTEAGGTATVAHGLGVAPELIIFKARSTTSNWCVYAAPLGTSDGLLLNSSAGKVAYGHTPSGAPSGTSFTVASLSGSATCVAYLFATCPGVSKVGSYNGNGTTLQVDCGFGAGAKFILIKRTDTAGHWCLFDSSRGIVSGDDPILLLNNIDPEYTGIDVVDPYAAGFAVNQGSFNLNVNGGTYIFLAIS